MRHLPEDMTRSDLEVRASSPHVQPYDRLIALYWLHVLIAREQEDIAEVMSQ
jgi:hypothetical protein